jgi:hypothetical protein
MPISVDNIIKLIKTIKPGEQIPGLSRGKFYNFISIEEAITSDASHPLNGLVLIKSSSTRKRPIRLFVNVLYLFLYEDLENLKYGRKPILFNQVKRSGLIDYIPNLSEFESHYKAVAVFLLKMGKEVDFDFLI